MQCDLSYCTPALYQLSLMRSLTQLEEDGFESIMGPMTLGSRAYPLQSTGQNRTNLN